MSVIFELITKIAKKDNALPIQDKVWSCVVDERWKFKVNGFRETKEGIPPFNVMVEYNGWPAGLIDPYGGIIAAGEAANEDTFIAELEKRLDE